MKEMILSVVIPCLNEATTIAAVIQEALLGLEHSELTGEVVVADNGSTDGSQILATQAGARVVNVPQRGYGAALHYGILSAWGKFVIIGDADLSYDFSLIYRFRDFVLEIDEAHTMDVVLGSRFKGDIEPGAMPILNRYLGTPALNLAIFLFFGFETSDCNSGMRVMRTEFYRRLPMRAPGMEYATELIIKSMIFKARYAEVPINLRRDQRGRRPHMRPWRDGWRNLKNIVLLSPTRLIFLPAFFVTVSGVLVVFESLTMGLTLTLLGMVGFCLGLIVKLVLHADGVIHSRMVEHRLRGAFTEQLLGLGLLGMISGTLSLICLPFSFWFCFLLLAGTLLAFTSFTWGVLVSHTINLLRSDVKP
jgi:glycosyltransferase involved in cell wall biosynthesis